MSVRYGDPNCKHEWRLRTDGWVEECVPAICIKCGAFGCICDSGNKLPWEQFEKEGQPGEKWEKWKR